MTQRVVITGVGAVTPIGHTAEASWQAALAGKSGVGWLSYFDTEQFQVKIAGEISDWDPLDYLNAKEIRRRDRYQVLAQVAARQAFENAGLELYNEAQRDRFSVCVGSAIGGMTRFSEQLHNVNTYGPRRMSPYGVPSFMTTGASSSISIELGSYGASYILTSACATGADCIGHVFDQIRLGRVDFALAGAAEAPILPNAIAGFDRLGACTHANSDPELAMRPFDRDRTGLVVSEGAAVLVLESLQSALKRGVTILAEIVGYAATSDAFHIVAPHPDGRGATKAMQKALDDAAVNIDQVNYINAHGTATELNDPMETLAIKHVFGELAYNIPISSTKSMTGHAMGASAAMEAMFSVFALRDQAIPPTINYEHPDPQCDLDYVPNTARDVPLRYVISNAFGFGGHNAVLVFKLFQE